MHTRRHILGIITTALAAVTTRGLAAEPAQDLLFIHGHGQSGYDPKVLETQWLDAFKRGAQKLGRTMPSSVKVAFPFYGDTLERFAKAASLPVTDDIQTRGAAPDNTFLVFQHQLAEEL